MLLGFNCFAAQKEYEIKTPQGFVSADIKDDKGDLAEIFSTNAQELNRYFEENNILYLATNKDYSEQIYLTVQETEFSKTTQSFSRIDEKTLLEISEKLAGNTFRNDGIVQGKDGVPFIKLYLETEDGYNVYEFITVCSNKMYSLRISSTEKTIEGLFASFFKTLEIKDNKLQTPKGDQQLFTVFAVLGIAVFTAVAAVLTFTVIRDLRTNRKSSEIEEEN